MIRNRYIVIICMCFLLVSCSDGLLHTSDEQAIKNLIKEALNDPRSAQFKDFIVDENSQWACITWNAKNTLGGYTDWKMTLFKKTGDSWSVLEEEVIVKRGCTELGFKAFDAKIKAENDAEQEAILMLQKARNISLTDAESLAEDFSECSHEVGRFVRLAGEYAFDETLYPSDIFRPDDKRISYINTTKSRTHKEINIGREILSDGGCRTLHQMIDGFVYRSSKERGADKETKSSEDEEEYIAGDLEWMLTNGEKVYKKNCIACHQAEGQGIPGVFPAIAGSAIATGPIDDHLDIVMNGKQGTAMAAFASQLSDIDIALVITYQRNAFGNDTGDILDPSTVQLNRSKN